MERCIGKEIFCSFRFHTAICRQQNRDQSSFCQIQTYNVSHHDLVVAAITSNVTDREYLILITSSDLDEGQLRVESGIRADKIYTFSNRIVIKKFGHIKPEVFAEVKQQLGDLFAE